MKKRYLSYKKTVSVILAVVGFFVLCFLLQVVLAKNSSASYALTEFNGVDAYAELGDTYILKDDGDYLEFTAKWNNMSSAYNGTVGLFGVGSTSYNTVGWFSATRFSVRGNNYADWLHYDVTGVDQAELHKYKVLITGTEVELFIDGETRGKKTLLQPVRTSHIANAWSDKFVNASVKDFTVHTGVLGTLSSSDIANDLTCHNCTTSFVDEPPVMTLNGDAFVSVPLGGVIQSLGPQRLTM